MNLFNNINSLQRTLDVSALRQRLISNNIANVDTPGYKTADVSFKEILDHKMANSNELQFVGNRTDSRHFVIGQATNQEKPKIQVQNNTFALNNLNNVDIEYEMTKLAENNIWYNSLTQIVNKEFTLLRNVITEGRR